MGTARRDESGLRDELTLMERAQHALPDDPSGALALVEEHERRFGDLLLAQEREVIAVAALSKLGRAREARARAERFIRQFPDSAHVARVRRMAAASASARTP
jgi:outer membrane protein assembly factor BamD (BamD/ComL family)